MHDLSPDEAQFRQTFRDYLEKNLRPLVDGAEDGLNFHRAAYEVLRPTGVFKLALPQSAGGGGAGALKLSLAVSEIARISGSAGLIPFPTNAVIRVLGRYADEAQKARWFPRFAQGDKLSAFCLTEPNHGSDAGNLTTRAERQGDHYLVNGAKAFITLGGTADFYLVFARTGPGPKVAGISALLIEKDTPGLSFDKVEKKMGLNGSVTQGVFFEDCPVPVENLVLGEGRGWEILTQGANPMRLWGAGSMALGLAQAALELAAEHVRGLPGGGGQYEQFTLADLAMRVEAVRSLVWRTARLIDSGRASTEEVARFTSMGKCFASDTAMAVTTDTMQLLGPQATRSGHPAQRLFRDAKGIQIFDGSNQIQRLIISRLLMVSRP